METPPSSTAKLIEKAVESVSTDDYGIPMNIRQRLPSLAKMQYLSRYPFTRINGPEERVIEQFMDISTREDDGYLRCRRPTAVARLLKDVDFPSRAYPAVCKQCNN